VVALTRANMFVPDGSIRAGVVNDLVKDERDNRESWLLIAASIALALVTLVPSGGASLAIPAGMASVGLAAYSALKELDKYEDQKVLYDTDLDRARALSDEEPSLTAFAMSLVSLGIEGVSLIVAFRAAVQLRRLAMTGEQEGARAKRLIDELNRTGGPHGNAHLGEDALRAGEPKPSVPTGHATEPAPKATTNWDDDITEEIPAQKNATTLSSGLTAVNRFTSREQVYKKVYDTLKGLSHGLEESKLPTEWPLVIKALKATPGTHNAEILELLPHVMGGLRDPELYAEVMADAWQIAKNAQTDINTALKEMARAGKLPIHTIPPEAGILKSKEFFDTVATRKAHWIDEPLFWDDHGEMTHQRGQEQRGVPRAARAGRGPGGRGGGLRHQGHQDVPQDQGGVGDGHEDRRLRLALHL
jgi:hypothetical protein